MFMSKAITFEEVKKHSTSESCWIIIDGLVYEVTNWLSRHPGGGRIIGHYGGQDASDAWKAMHPNREYAHTFLAGFQIGRLLDERNENCDDKNSKVKNLLKDFRALRQDIEDVGLMKARYLFFLFHFLHILAFELVAYILMRVYNESCAAFMLVSLLLATAQTQSGWTQHDCGHLSVLDSSKLNHFMQHIFLGHIKGASCHWWNFRHLQHHVKPNIVQKDPDVAVARLFLLGDVIPKIWGRKKRGIMPYHWQHWYFWLIGPPLLLPVYFLFENIYFIIKRKDWVDTFWIVSFFCRFFYLYGSILGGFKACGLYMLMRSIESCWFVVVTQMNHIPMAVDMDLDEDWVTLQFKSTCNVEGSPFNDWFTGGLNYQLEHHLFPRLPRQNLPKVAPMIKRLALKHNLAYIEKSLVTALLDIHRSLERSGQLWWEAYNSKE